MRQTLARSVDDAASKKLLFAFLSVCVVPSIGRTKLSLQNPLYIQHILFMCCSLLVHVESRARLANLSLSEANLKVRRQK